MSLAPLPPISQRSGGGSGVSGPVFDNSTVHDLEWIALGVLAWLAVKMMFPQAAGAFLIVFAIAVILALSPQLRSLVVRGGAGGGW